MVRRLSWTFLGAIIALHVVLTTFLNLVVFRYKWLDPITSATRGFASGTLVGNLFFLAIMLGLLFKVGKLKPKDLALHGEPAQSIVFGVVWTATAIVLLHMSAFAFCIFSSAEVVWQWPNWSQIVGQFFGNAFYEELMFRALLIPQLVLLIKKAKRKWSWATCLLFALLASQFVFALIHIPNRIYLGSYATAASVIQDQVKVLIIGLLFAWVFLSTRNLYAAIGVHALVNKSVILIVLPSGDLILSVFLIIPLAYLWNGFVNRSKTRAESLRLDRR